MKPERWAFPLRKSTVTTRMDDLENYPPLYPGESYAARRRRLENEMEKEIRTVSAARLEAGRNVRPLTP